MGLDRTISAKLWLAIVVLMIPVSQCASDSTQIYATLPTQLEISIPESLKNLELQNCIPSQKASAAGGVEVKSNVEWSLAVSGDTPNGRMVGSSGSPAHELLNPMTVQTTALAGGPVTIPGSESDPAAVALLSGVSPGDYSGTNIIDLQFEQPFEWSDYGNENYRLIITFVAGPA